jgi:hypothetical protein
MAGANCADMMADDDFEPFRSRLHVQQVQQRSIWTAFGQEASHRLDVDQALIGLTSRGLVSSAAVRRIAGAKCGRTNARRLAGGD